MKRILTILMVCLTMAAFAAPKTMEKAEKKKLNVFFSNFSEANVESFKQGALSDETLLNFALRHVYLNQFKSLKMSKDKFSVLVPASQIDTATMKYFGKKIQKHKEPINTIPLADGEAFHFSQINALEDLGNLTFKAEGTTYSTGSGGIPDVHGTPETWKKAGEEVEVSGTFSALIKAEGESYILLEYTLTDSGPSETKIEPKSEPTSETNPEPKENTIKRRNH